MSVIFDDGTEMGTCCNVRQWGWGWKQFVWECMGIGTGFIGDVGDKLTSPRSSLVIRVRILGPVAVGARVCRKLTAF